MKGKSNLLLKTNFLGQRNFHIDNKKAQTQTTIAICNLLLINFWDALLMINSLVNSAIKNGCLSVASESLLRQLINMEIYNSSDLDALVNLQVAFKSGQIKREACNKDSLFDRWDNFEMNMIKNKSYITNQL